MDHPSAVGEVFNIGSSEEVSIKALAERVQSLTGTSSAIVHVPYAEAYEEGFEDMPRRVPDISKISDLVGYSPTVALDEILHRVITHFRGDAIPRGDTLPTDAALIAAAATR